MNAAVRAVVRTAHHYGISMFAIYEGYQGMVRGGDAIRKMSWSDVGGIIQLGGTVIGSARSAEFRKRAGRLTAAQNLVERGIDGLVVIGGDGSLTGANLFREEWGGLLAELVADGRITEEAAAKHPYLQIVGLVGSIDNDMFGTDMTVGADTALHRIVNAVDTITSTAASHHRTFVIEVMGRNCGYLALMSGLATGANFVLIPECPPNVDHWEDEMCRMLQASRNAGRRHGIVIIAEGAQDRNGRHISSHYVKDVLEHRLGSDTRITILGHVQRGGAPSAFDRFLSTVLGARAVRTLIQSRPEEEPQLLGIRQNRVTAAPLMECVRKTKEVAEVIANQDYATALKMRGGSFGEAWEHLQTMQRAHPKAEHESGQGRRFAVLHCGGPAPGMNTAARSAVRLGIDRGHTVLGVLQGFRGLLRNRVQEMTWMSVHGWAPRGGAELGTARLIPRDDELQELSERLMEHKVEGLLLIGGWSSYKAAYQLYRNRDRYPALNVPICCIPASIDNNLPESEYSIGVDTALNAIADNIDKIKQSAVASRRCFVVEVMGRDCGYLALISGIATGAERVYLPEEGITLDDLKADVDRIASEFKKGKRLGLFIRSEKADRCYTTEFIARLFEREGQHLFDVRTAVLGHVQQGGNPSPYDRIQATRLAAHGIDMLEEQFGAKKPAVGAIGLRRGQVTRLDLASFPDLIEPKAERPKDQPWLRIRNVARAMAYPHAENRSVVLVPDQ